MPDAPDVFVSYTQADRPWAEWIAWVLEDAGFSTVIQAWDFAAGDNFVAGMQQVSAEARRTIAVLSPEYMDSRWGEWEWTSALAQKRLVPVRVREFDPAGLLNVTVYVDLVGFEEQAARERLIAEIERDGGRAKPAHQPAFPGGAVAMAPAPRFPGALPDIWNVPAIRSPNFAGREDDLARLDACLDSKRVVALTGLGGVGKSQLAAQYAHRHAGDYDVVWWVTAEPATLARDLAALAARLELPEAASAGELTAAEAARRRLEQRGGWLLVLDNAPDPAAVRSWLPQADTGHVLITSRYAAWGGSAYGQRLAPLGGEGAVRVLEGHAGDHEPALMHGLADRLGGLPLALEQAGAYLEATGMSPTEYLQLFEHSAGRAAGARQRPHGADRGHDLGARLPAAHRAGTDRRRPAHRSAFLAPEDIPRTLFADSDALPEGLQPLADALTFNDALAALAQLLADHADRRRPLRTPARPGRHP